METGTGIEMTVKKVQIAARLQEARELSKMFWGAEYGDKICECRKTLQAVQDTHKCGVLQAMSFCITTLQDSRVANDQTLLFAAAAAELLEESENNSVSS